MPVRLRPERQILEDIVKYKTIAQKLDDVDDIPQRRTKPSTSKKSPAKNKKKAGASKAKKKTAASKTKKKTHVSKTEKIKPPLKRSALEELKERIFRQKPSFMGKAPVPFLKTPVAALEANASKPLENESRFPTSLGADQLR
ncbi:hypothetical protein METBIDRAFT_13179 [Metschnikowia bicuspidata var. bicuspidata NRRL YB-4993]|uniref:Uncharacterized protein n=1 Tax=Metschnikowia bicuspidata var. bicuspidata NRRL YB-4993 TaxID=869754 RepID=A0A1A0H8F9_9ASCO|nr:hypothetical protein METBIDRAFT_13179 [Metschnikowia bicuspidata var. bicuspidata NRRL YB-4993]OBA20173.1 hypothetical protein METBIDRAFT_13179 [Metschnikowia bicuspidata var. bicuspidata NRRL YB-4993]